MDYQWYKIFNIQDFADTGLISRTYTVDLQERGEVEVLVTVGNYVGMTYDDKFFPVNFGVDKNPFVLDDMASYLDAEGDAWLGFEVEE